jgi:ATP-dependent protease ClpP protease subunit
LTDLIDDELLKRRAVCLAGPVRDAVAVDVIARQLFLQHQDHAAPVYLSTSWSGRAAN